MRRAQSWKAYSLIAGLVFLPALGFPQDVGQGTLSVPASVTGSQGEVGRGAANDEAESPPFMGTQPTPVPPQDLECYSACACWNADGTLGLEGEVCNMMCAPKPPLEKRCLGLVEPLGADEEAALSDAQNGEAGESSGGSSAPSISEAGDAPPEVQ